MVKEKKNKDLNSKVKEQSLSQKRKKLKNAAIANSSFESGILTQLCKTNINSSLTYRSKEQNKNTSELSSLSNKNENPSTSTTSEDLVMDWEPTEYEIIKTLHEIRREIPPEISLKPILGSVHKFIQTSSVLAHVVIDTNIFLSHLPTTKLLVENQEICSKVQIYVPWMVLQELDYMKSNKGHKLKLDTVARKAASFIFDQISKKNPFFCIQTLDEFKNCINLLPDENADDKILQWCLYLKKDIPAEITLLSNDILFCAKASACGIQALQSKQFISQLPQMLDQQLTVLNEDTSSATFSSVDSTINETISCNNDHLAPNKVISLQKIQIKDQHPSQLEAKETFDSSTFLQQYEDSILDPMSQVLEYEMKQVFDELWCHIVLVKPPWKLADIFRCIEKHWIAVFGYVYPRDMREKIDHLNSLWKQFAKTGLGLQRKQCELLVESTISVLRLIQRTRKQFHKILSKPVDGLKELMNREIIDDSFILDLFNRLWDRFNFICGTLCEAVGITNHGLQFKAGAAIPSPQEVSTGMQMMIPLLNNLESVLSRLFQYANTCDSSATLQSISNELSNCLLLSVNELGLQVIQVAPLPLSLALIRFVSNAQHREKVQNGLEQLRIYIQVLQSITVRSQ